MAALIERDSTKPQSALTLAIPGKPGECRKHITTASTAILFITGTEVQATKTSFISGSPVRI